MRVCQFRHYGTVFYAPHKGPEHANRELQSFKRGRRCQFFRRRRLGPGCSALLLQAGMLVAANLQVARRLRLLIKKGVYLVKEGYISK